MEDAAANKGDVELVGYREFIGYLYLAYVLGKAAYPKFAGPPSPEDVVEEVLTSLAEAKLDPNRLRYDPQRRVLRVKRQGLAAICEESRRQALKRKEERPEVGANTAERFFDKTKPLDRYFRSFARAFGTAQVLFDPNDQASYRVWRSMVGSLGTSARLLGIPVIGSRGEPFAWIGLANVATFRKLARKSADGYPERTQVAKWCAPKGINRCPPLTRLSWISQVAPGDSLNHLAKDPMRFTGFCQELAAELRRRPLPELGEEVDSSVVVLASTPNRVLAPSAEPLLVCTQESFEKAKTLLARAGIGQDQEVLVLDGERLIDCLSHFPWVWSHWLRRTNEPQVLRAEQKSRVRDALLPTSLAAHLDHMSPIRHAALPHALPKSFIVGGRAGSGKSTAIWQVISEERSYDLVLLMQPGDRVGVAKTLLEERHAICDGAVVCVLEDLHRESAPAGRTDLDELLRAAKAYSGTTVDFLGTYQTSAEYAFRDRYGAALDAHHIGIFQLDVLPPQFFDRLTRELIANFQVQLDGIHIADFVRVFVAQAATPYAVTLFFHARTGSVVTSVDDAVIRDGWEHWRRTFGSLSTVSQGGAELLVMFTVLRRICELRVRSRLLWDAYQSWRPQATLLAGSFEQVLKDFGWLREIDGWVYADDLQVRDEVFRFDDVKWQACVRAIAPHILGGIEISDPHEKVHLTYRLATVEEELGSLADARDHLQRTARLAETAGSVLPFYGEIHYALSCVLFACGEHELAITQARQALLILEATGIRYLIGKAQGQVGCLLAHVTRYAEALPHLRAARQLLAKDDPEYVRTLLILGGILMRLKLRAEGRSVLDDLERVPLTAQEQAIVTARRHTLGQS